MNCLNKRLIEWFKVSRLRKLENANFGNVKIRSIEVFKISYERL